MLFLRKKQTNFEIWLDHTGFFCQRHKNGKPDFNKILTKQLFKYYKKSTAAVKQ
jgi:hypothetical protein